MDLSYKEDQAMRKAFNTRFPEWDLQAAEIEWNVDEGNNFSYTWIYSLNGEKYKQKLIRETREITISKAL